MAFIEVIIMSSGVYQNTGLLPRELQGGKKKKKKPKLKKKYVKRNK